MSKNKSPKKNTKKSKAKKGEEEPIDKYTEMDGQTLQM